MNMLKTTASSRLRIKSLKYGILTLNFQPLHSLKVEDIYLAKARLRETFIFCASALQNNGNMSYFTYDHAP